MSAQRVTYAVSRDNLLPGSKYFRKLSSGKKMPINAALLVVAISIAVTTAVIGSVVAFSAITATATIATNVSYLFPIVARHTGELFDSFSACRRLPQGRAILCVLILYVSSWTEQL